MNFVPDNPWDRVEIDGKAIPAPCTVSRLSNRGYSPQGTFDIKLDAYAGNWNAVQGYLKTLDPMRVDPVSVDHPVFSMYRIQQVRVQEIGHARPSDDVLGNPIKTITITVVEA